MGAAVEVVEDLPGAELAVPVEVNLSRADAAERKRDVLQFIGAVGAPRTLVVYVLFPGLQRSVVIGQNGQAWAGQG